MIGEEVVDATSKVEMDMSGLATHRPGGGVHTHLLLGQIHHPSLPATMSKKCTKMSRLSLKISALFLLPNWYFGQQRGIFGDTSVGRLAAR